MTHHKFKLNTLSFFLLNLFCSGAVLAQQETPKKVDAHPPIAELSAITAESQQEETAFDPVVGYVAKRSASATRTDTPINEIPQSISVIGAQQIKDQGSQTLAEAIRYSPGISTNTYGANNTRDWFFMRGSPSIVFEDGLSDSLDLGSRGDTLTEPFAYERIEALRGSNAVITGNNYPGGFVNLVSKRPQADNFRELSLSYGSYNFKKIAADFTGALDKESKWLYRFIAVTHDSDTQIKHTKSKSVLVKPMLTWRPDNKTELTLFADYQRDNNTLENYFPTYGSFIDRPIGKIPIDRYFGEPGYDKGRGTTKRIGWEFSRKINDNWQLKHHFRYAHLDKHFRMIYPLYWIQDIYYDKDGLPDRAYGEYMQRGIDTRVEKRISYSTDLSIEGKFNTGSLQHNALLAIDTSHIHGHSGQYETTISPLNVYNPIYGNFTAPKIPYIPRTNNKLRSFGITLQDQIKIGDNLILTGTARYDRAHSEKGLVSQTHHRVSPRLGIVWLAGNGFSPYLSYSESFQNWYGTRKFNGELAKPLIAKQFEAGIKWQPTHKNALLSAAIFKSKEENTFTPDLEHPGFMEQLGEVTRKGLELEAGFSLDNWDIISQYTYNRSYTSKTVPAMANQLKQQNIFIPRHSASLWVAHKFDHLGIPNLRVGAGIVYRGKVGDGVKDGAIVPAVTTVDMMASYDKGPLTLSLNINNLTDRKSFASCEIKAKCTYIYRRNIVGNISYKW